MSATNARTSCPVCQREVPVTLVEELSGYRIWRCSACGLQFADPMAYSADAYGSGYAEAGSELDRQADYSGHVEYGEWLANIPDLTPFLIPLERRALDWLRKNLAPGAPVLDLGCGAGRFLLALRQYGFHPLGLEVAEAPVGMLQRQGLAVRQGTLDGFGPEWPEPAAIVCFEVLEHLPDPVGFLSAIGQRFPRAPLLLAVPYAASRRRCDPGFRKGDYPPNHLTRWDRRSLAAALGQAGYGANVSVVHVSGEQLHLEGNPLYRFAMALRRALAGGGSTPARSTEGVGGHEAGTPPDWRSLARKNRLKRLIQAPYLGALRLAGATGYWLLAIARKKES